MKLRPFLRDTEKAAGAATIGAAAALSAGLLTTAEAGYITGAAAVVSAVVVYLLPGPKRD